MRITILESWTSWTTKQKAHFWLARRILGGRKPSLILWQQHSDFASKNVRACKENDCTAGYGWPFHNDWLAVDIMAVLQRQVSQTLLSSTSLGEKCFRYTDSQPCPSSPSYGFLRSTSEAACQGRSSITKSKVYNYRTAPIVWHEILAGVYFADWHFFVFFGT